MFFEVLYNFADLVNSALTILANAHHTSSIRLDLVAYERNASINGAHNIGFLSNEYGA